MILWLIDRFEMPGWYFTTWLSAMQHEGIDPRNTRLVSLHKELRTTLLTSFASRKAPTWLPEKQSLIMNHIEKLTRELNAEAVVLSSPESLVMTGVHPEHATLHNLRGSVYWRNEIPHLVILPMSTWKTLVNQKDIGKANYGFESQEDFQKNIVTLRAGADGVFDEGAVAPEEGEAGEAEGDSGDDDSEDEEDEFFYEPVLSPVGRFTITADIQKLKRILTHGRESRGPEKPIELRYR